MNAKPAKMLSAPLRVYWDLCPENSGGISARDAEDIAGQLAALRVFFVTLRLLEGKRDGLGAVINILKTGGSKVVVSVASPESMPEKDVLADAGGLDLYVSGRASLGKLIERLSPPDGMSLSVSMVPDSTNLTEVVEVVKAALGAGIKTFYLINPDLVNGAKDAAAYALNAPQRAEFKAAIEDVLKPLGNDVRLFVHDLFLHKALELPGLGGRIEYAGCQAGDAIAYIDKKGLVYPCATLAKPLGDLTKATLKEVWGSEHRRTIRERLVAIPDECAPCKDVDDCKGGCRGLAWAVGGPNGNDSKDPNCQK
jgi:GeoRSP system SPASM domain protein